jgi:phospholipase/carboxylesterase
LPGPADHDRQLLRVIPHVSSRNYVGVAPRGVVEAEAAHEGFEWHQEEAAIESAERRVFECMEIAADRYHVSGDSVFLAGYQCGGTMALRIGLRHPSLFAGAISLGGPFPTGLAPLSQLRNARGFPLFIAQGRESRRYSPQRTCEELRLFHSAAMHVMLRQYPCADEMTTQMLSDLNVWIMEQVTGVSQAETCDLLAFPNEWN